MSPTARALLKTGTFAIVAPGFVAVGVPYLLLGPRAEFEIGMARFAGAVPILLGAMALLWCAWDFVFAGRGTPAPIDPPRVLVVKGLYRFVRNPMYIALGLVLGGEAIFFESYRLLIYALLAWLACHLFVVSYEEPTLKKNFGAAYEAYRQAVPRWVPRVTRRTGTNQQPSHLKNSGW
jgi:protein-S-isoprenylcysteine O-methyltransferase Ste14